MRGRRKEDEEGRSPKGKQHEKERWHRRGEEEEEGQEEEGG